jgi:uncharacterized membrane protein YidH (DUF202 family)
VDELETLSTASGAVPVTSAVLRTRMAWIRTSLAVIITGFLLVRGGLTNAEPLTLAALAGVVSIVVIATAMGRFKRMGQAQPPILGGRIPRVITGGIIALALIACIRLVLS